MMRRPAAGAPVGGADVVVVGNEGELPQLLQGPLLAGDGPLVVRAVVPLPVPGDDDNPDDPTRVPMAAIREAVQRHAATALLMAGTHGPRVLAALGELGVALGCRLLVPAPGAGAGQLSPVVTWVRDVPVLEMVPFAPPPQSGRVKRGMDVVVAVAGLVAVAPVLVLLAAVIRAESAGNPFFGHQRVGAGGRRFRCWKLRTMYANAEERLERDPVLRQAYEANDFKLPDTEDPRITRVGRWLRRSSLDELPQLWNVVVGEMSLVGPRPVVANELAHYRGTMLELLSVRPGITGAWVANGRHGVAYPQRASLELDYVRHHTFRGDLAILLGTVKAVLRPGGE
jgi:lipopolysaccharide/colanic/teichoic acid biosynthesis glycosyltransferase